MGRHSCCQKQKLKKGLWSPEEDEKLVHYITKYGHGCWSTVPKQAGLQRCGKSCRLRWINYLRPDLKRGIFSAEEEKLIIELHSALGNRWSQIATQLPGRTDNEIKNYWNTCIKKKLRQAGIDPNTHKPIVDNAVESSSTMSSNSQQNNATGDMTTSSSDQQQIQGVASAVAAGDSPARNTNKKPRMYPAVLEDILFPGRISESKAGLLPSTSQQLQLQQQQQQQGKQLTTDNLLEKFISSSMDKQQVSSLMPSAASSCTGSNGSTSSCLDFSANLRQQQQAEFSFPVPSCSTSNFGSPIFWVLSNAAAPGSALEAPPTSTQFAVDLPSSLYGESSSFMGALRPGNNTSSSCSSPLVSVSMDRYWDTTGSSRWNYSHKLESSDGSCESLSLESPAQRWADLLPAATVAGSCGMQELDQHHHQQQHHHHHHNHHHLNGSSKFLGADAQQVVSWPPTMATTTTTSSSSIGDLSAYGSIMSPELQRLSAVIDQIM